MSEVTIVTAYYQMKSKFNHEKYVQWMSNMLPYIKTPMVIFTDEQSAALIQQLRNGLPASIIILKQQEWYVYREYKDLWTKHYDMDPEKYHTVDLYMVWNEKSYFLKRAIDMNVFKSKYFIWCDIGCFRNKAEMPMYVNWPSSEKMKQYGHDKVILNYLGEFSNHQYHIDETTGLSCDFQRENHIGGGIFGGSEDALKKWIYVYYEMLSIFFKYDRFAGKDQNVMANVVLRFPNLANLIRPMGCCPDPWFHLEHFLN